MTFHLQFRPVTQAQQGQPFVPMNSQQFGPAGHAIPSSNAGMPVIQGQQLHAAVDSKTNAAWSSCSFITSYTYAIYSDKPATDIHSTTFTAKCSPFKQSYAWLGCFSSSSSFFICMSCLSFLSFAVVVDY